MSQNNYEWDGADEQFQNLRKDTRGSDALLIIVSKKRVHQDSKVVIWENETKHRIFWEVHPFNSRKGRTTILWFPNPRSLEEAIEIGHGLFDGYELR